MIERYVETVCECVSFNILPFETAVVVVVVVEYLYLGAHIHEHHAGDRKWSYVANKRLLSIR